MKNINSSIPMNQFVYIHCRDFIRFQEIKDQYEDEQTQCIFIEDSYTLRARTPGPIIIDKTAEESLNDHEISDSISIYKEQWKVELQKIDQSQNDIEYGV